VTSDRYGDEFPREHFRKCGIAYEPSKAPKGELYLGLLPLLYSGKVHLMPSWAVMATVDGAEPSV
jgi:hypothetical protein